MQQGKRIKRRKEMNQCRKIKHAHNGERQDEYGKQVHNRGSCNKVGAMRKITPRFGERGKKKS